MNLSPHRTQHWQVQKPVASGARGMVVSQSNDAAAAGIAILDAGGNAADAAVTTALALAATEPWNSGLGGIGFALIHPAGQPRATVIDFGPRAPAKLTPDRFRLTGRTGADLFAWPEVEGDANVHGPPGRDPRDGLNRPSGERCYAWAHYGAGRDACRHSGRPAAHRVGWGDGWADGLMNRGALWA